MSAPSTHHRARAQEAPPPARCAPRPPFGATLVAAVAAFVAMALLHVAILFLLPWMSPWQSHCIAGACAALCVAAAASCFLRRERRLCQQTLGEAAGRQRAEKRLTQSEARYRAVFHNLPVGLYRTGAGPQWETTMANPAIAEMFGCEDAQEFVAAGFDARFAKPEDRDAWRRKLLSEGDTHSDEFLFERSDGTTFWGAVTALSVHDEAGEMIHVDGVVQDITRQRQAEQERDDANRLLEVYATTDALTGLLNRRVVLERLGEELERARRSGRPLAIIIADIDHFKHVNDLHGHLAGDRVLAAFAQRLRRNCRPYDMVGRYGGEEFLVVLPEADASHAGAAAERARRLIAGTPMRLESGREVTVTASFGVAEAAAEVFESIEAFITRADDALYQAKAQGRNSVAVASSPADMGDEDAEPTCAAGTTP